MKTNIKAIHAVLTRVSEGFLLYVGLQYLAQSESKIQAVFTAFMVLWVFENWAMWFYKSVIVPTAKHISKENK